MNTAQHLIIVARTRLVPVEMFARGRWVVVEMTDNRAAIERKFQALQRLSSRFGGKGRPLIEAAIFASEKADIGRVSVAALLNVDGPPKLADVFVTDKVVRFTFWRQIYSKLGQPFEPPVAHYDAIEAERLFASETARTVRRRRVIPWAQLRMWGAVAAVLLVVGFTGAWLIENAATWRQTAPSPQEAAAQDQPITRDQADTRDRELTLSPTKAERLSGLAEYFSEDE